MLGQHSNVSRFKVEAPSVPPKVVEVSPGTAPDCTVSALEQNRGRPRFFILLRGDDHREHRRLCQRLVRVYDPSGWRTFWVEEHEATVSRQPEFASPGLQKVRDGAVRQPLIHSVVGESVSVKPR